jgi:hypothetical protein
MARGPALAGSGIRVIAPGAGGGRGNPFGFKGVIRASGPEGSRVAFLNPSDTSINRNLFASVKPLGVLPLKIPGGSGENGKSGIGMPSFQEFTPGQINQLKASGERPKNPARGSVRFEPRNSSPQAETRTVVSKKAAGAEIGARAYRVEIFRGNIGELRNIVVEAGSNREIRGVQLNPVLEQVRRMAMRRRALYQSPKTDTIAKPQPEQKQDISKPGTSVRLKTAAAVGEKVIVKRTKKDDEIKRQKRLEKLQERRKVVVDDRLQSQRIAALDAARRKILATEPDGMLTIERVVAISGVADFRAYRSPILEGTEHEDGGQVRMRKSASSDLRPVTESALAEFADRYVPVMAGEGRDATRKQFITVVTLPDELEPAVDPETYFNPENKTRIIEREETAIVASERDYIPEEQIADTITEPRKDREKDPVLPVLSLRGSLRLDKGLYINNEGEELALAA